MGTPLTTEKELITTIEHLRLELAEEREQMAHELDFARKIQEQFLPPLNSISPTIEISASVLPARLLSGDLYLVDQSDKNHVTITVGDVAGKGIPASLLMALAHERLSMISERSLPPHKILAFMNEWLAKRFSHDRFLTLIRAEIDLNEMRLSVSSGGHPSALLYRTKDKSFIEVESGGVVLGPFIESRFTTEDFSLCEGDVLLFISDGVLEMEDAALQQFGVERLKEILKASDCSTAKTIHESILSAVQDHAKKNSLTDDATLVTVVIKPKKIS